MTVMPNGNLLGTCWYGGDFGGVISGGTLWEFDPTSLQFTVRHSFEEGQYSARPCGDLVLHPDGSYWGTQIGGGANSRGSVFRYDPSDQSFQQVHQFEDNEARYVDTGLLPFPEIGLVGGSSETGCDGFGEIFSFPLDGNTYSTVDCLESVLLKGKLTYIAEDTSLLGFDHRSYFRWSPATGLAEDLPIGGFDFNPLPIGGLVSVPALRLGLEEAIPTSETSIYPSPADQDVTIRRTNKGSAIVELYDVLGHLVLRTPISGTTARIPVSQLSNGTYIVKLQNEKGGMHLVVSH